MMTVYTLTLFLLVINYSIELRLCGASAPIRPQPRRGLHAPAELLNSLGIEAPIEIQTSVGFRSPVEIHPPVENPSQHFDLCSQFDRYPNGELIPWTESFWSSAGPHSSAGASSSANVPSPPACSPHSISTESPLEKYPFSPGYKFLRFISMGHAKHLFQVRRYAFPYNNRLKFLLATQAYVPIPNQVYSVFSTPAGDVFAVLENEKVLLGVYAYSSKKDYQCRVKVNMISGMITSMTPEEISEVPVGRRRWLSQNFYMKHVNDTLQHH